MNKEDISTKDIQSAIVRTIAFFDLFSQPLTPNEVWQFLNNKISREKIFEELKRGIEGVDKKHGFHFLKGRHNLVEERMF